MLLNNFQKIAEHKIQPYGLRGLALSIPKVYIDDLKIKAKSQISIYRGKIDEIDCLVLVPKKDDSR